MRDRMRIYAAGLVVCACTTITRADVTGYLEEDDWVAAVGAFTTINFTGQDQWDVITDQYNDLGVTFTDGNDFIYHTGAFVNDGIGLHGSWNDLQITIEFDEPLLWFGINHPGPAEIELYLGDQMVGSYFNAWGTSDAFTGVVSKALFDRVRVTRPLTQSAPLIDDLHFGIPAPGAIAVLALAGMLCPGRRRSRT